MEAINEAARTPSYLPTKKVKELDPSILYTLTGIKKVKTRFGTKVVVELEAEFDIFLPSKVNHHLIHNQEAYDKLVDEMEKRNVQLKYLGGCLLEFI